MNQLQQDILSDLCEHVVDLSVLEIRCPLDYGKHDVTHDLDSTLGNFCAMPTELQLIALSFLAIKSLLVFRRVSKYAVNLVTAMTDTTKWSFNAPDTLRMAIAIRTHNHYTISALCRAPLYS